MKSDHIKTFGKAALIAALLNAASGPVNAQAATPRDASNIAQYPMAAHTADTTSRSYEKLAAKAASGESIAHAGYSMPQATVESAQSDVIERFMGDAAGFYRIDADAWMPPAIESSAKATVIDGERSKAVQIGYPREIPAQLRALPMTALPWTI